VVYGRVVSEIANTWCWI